MAEDRCHLNGLAVIDGEPRYVTAFAESDTLEGWRSKNANGGCVIDVKSDQVVCRGLSMPHSPRHYDGRLWVLDSGTGRLTTMDPSTGSFEPVVSLPGYTRGLAFYDRFAFVGLSQIRETTTFSGVPIAERRNQLRCGVWVVDLDSSKVVACVEFDRGINEVFDVAVVPGIRFPEVIGLQKEAIKTVFAIPTSRRGPDTDP